MDENQAKGTVVGALTAIDPDAVDAHTFSIVGGRDRKFFAVEDGNLVAKVPFDFETQPEREVVVRVYDKRKAQGEFPLTITVNDVNDPHRHHPQQPSDRENQPEGTMVGKLYLVDVDGGSDEGVGSGGGSPTERGTLGPLSL